MLQIPTQIYMYTYNKIKKFNSFRKIIVNRLKSLYYMYEIFYNDNHHYAQISFAAIKC